MILVHYKDKEFNRKLVKEIKNSEKRYYLNKPEGGLWTSPIDSEYGWREFLREGNLSSGRKRLEHYVLFKIKDSIKRKLFIVNSEEDVLLLPRIMINNYTLVDFERLANMGYSGLWLTWKGQVETRYTRPGGIEFYGWDVETVLLFSMNGVEEAKIKIPKIPTKNWKNIKIKISTKKNKNGSWSVIDWWNNPNTDNTTTQEKEINIINIPLNKYSSRKSAIRSLRKLIETFRDDPNLKIYECNR